MFFVNFEIIFLSIFPAINSKIRFFKSEKLSRQISEVSQTPRYSTTTTGGDNKIEPLLIITPSHNYRLGVRNRISGIVRRKQVR